MRIRACNALGLVSLLVVHLCSSNAKARRVESWTFERLTKEADLVVIAVAKSSADCEDPPADKMNAGLKGLNTVLEVRSVLKGKIEVNTITVFHYRVPPNKVLVDRRLLVFHTKGTHARIRTTMGISDVQTATPNYLLFLRRREDGRYEPVSGQVDPHESAMELLDPDIFGQDDEQRPPTTQPAAP